MRGVVKRQSKYNNKKFEINGIKYDSKREYQRHLVLLDAEKKGLISALELHPTYELVPNQYTKGIKHLKTKDKDIDVLLESKIKYIADFRYIKNNQMVVEDVKISKELFPKEYVLKRKLLLYVFGIRLKEVFHPNDII